MKIIISDKNSKLGKIPNISLIPVKDCANCDHCMSDCYALKAWKQYPPVRTAWKSNSDAFRKDILWSINEVDEWLLAKRKPVKYFRIHVAGDFLTQAHVDAWTGLAVVHEGTKFLAFTKRHDLDFSNAPSNLQIIFSQWPGMPNDAPKGSRSSWVQDGTETRIPDTAIECSGKCDDCFICFELGFQDVYFDQH